MEKKYSDKELVEALQGSSEQAKNAINYIYHSQQWRGKAYGAIRKILPTLAYADDIFDESIMKLIDKIIEGAFKGDGSLQAYFIGICRFHCLQHLEKETKRKTRLQTVGSENQDNDTVISQMIKTESEEEVEKLIERLISKLPEKCIEVLRALFWNNQKRKEIAELLQINPQSVSNRRDRCLKKIRDIIKEDTKVMEVLKNRI